MVRTGYAEHAPGVNRYDLLAKLYPYLLIAVLLFFASAGLWAILENR